MWIHAIHIPNITDQYIAIENNNLKEFFAKFGMDTESIPDQIKTVDTMAILQKYQDKIDLAKEKYIKVLSDNLTQDQFSKAKGFQLNVDGKDYETTQYSLKMTEQEVYDVYQKVYETLYQDQETLQLIVDLVNETNMNQLTIESLQQKLEDSKEEIDNMASQENLADATVTFNVYYVENAVLKTEVLHSEGDSLALTFLKS